jgi:D-lactate dehydrogenase
MSGRRTCVKEQEFFMSATGAARASLSKEELKQNLARITEDKRVLTRPIDLIAYAADASFYRLIPKAVVQTRSVDEIQSLFRFSHEHRMPLTFRAAGSSLSGQAVTDGVLVEVARYWRQLNVEENGRRVRVQPGVIGARVNQELTAYGAKMGPDPASIATCMMGGILANNSSGMCCGVEQNAYHTIRSMKFVLPSGTVIDTADPNAEEIFLAREPKLAQGILELKQKIDSNTALRDRIRAKYRMKNTTGYSLNAFVDFDRAVDIMQHVLIGSEGTLAFIAEAVLDTVPDLPVKYTGLLLFPDLHAASASIVPLREAGAKALEIMDRASLRSVEDQAGIPASIKKLPAGASGLLVEFQSANEWERSELESLARHSTGGLKLVEPATFTHSAAEQAALWKIRAGMFPSVGSVRKSGTTVIIEDVAFPIEKLADAAVDLTKLFAKHQYDNGIIFGHAKDGNLHFVITQSFRDRSAVDQYSRFIDDVVELVVNRYDGALKAEHGTGRNMAPFVQTEWGTDGYEIMKRLKRLADPDNLLNPGVIINPDPKSHLANLKPLPSVEEEVDKCIECGYCETKCPSRELTTTPRQRIVIRREMARLKESGNDAELLASLEAAFPYDVLDTCAVDGLCATACPVSIDTGQLTKRLRKARHTEAEHRWAERIARNFAHTETLARMALRMGHTAEKLIGTSGVVKLSEWMQRMTGGALATWSKDMPHAATRSFPETQKAVAVAVYFPSCISRVMGRIPGEPKDMNLMEAFVTLAQRAGRPVYLPPDVAGTCCGTPFSSKGFDRANAIALNNAFEKLWQWTERGRLPVVVDTSPCTYGLLKSRHALNAENQRRFDKLRILDGIEFTHDELLPRLKINQRASSVALHPVCSVTKLNLTPKLQGIAKVCSEMVHIPLNAGCCGFAGDRGFLVPELTASATKHEAAEVKQEKHDGYFSSSRTCEIGMTRSTGEIYRSYIYMLEMATR